MATIDRDLVRVINSGNCFVLIGSGPSCEIGLPTWQNLAQLTVGNFKDKLDKNQLDKIKKLISDKNYPKAFGELAKRIQLNEILDFIKPMLEIKNKNGKIYNYLINWPFSCYLTTNYDDGIAEYAKANGQSLLTKKNTIDDLKHIRSDSKDMIFKIHGDTSDPNNIVLTEEQYNNYRINPDKEYWREKISSVLHMVDLVILGYSVSDPDFKDQLERAKVIATPEHPIFMFATGIRPEEMKEYFLNFNIRVISYKNESGTHLELLKMLQRYNPFIAKRGSGNIGLKVVDEEQATRAASMYLFTQLRLSDVKERFIVKIYSFLILQILFHHFKDKVVEFSEIKLAIEKEKYFNSNIDPVALNTAIEYLYDIGFIDLREVKISLIEKGKQAIETVSSDRTLLKEKFLKTCDVFLENHFPDIKPSQYSTITAKMREGLIRAFEKRGMEIAQSIYKNKQLDISDNVDILDIINASGNSLNPAERVAFSDLMIEILLSPSVIMKDYLSALTQGYFSYHALGLDPTCYNKRLEIAQKSKWILDSSILLPLFAVNCNNHDYAVDLLMRLQSSGLVCITTELLLNEVVEHAAWALKHIARLEKSPVEMLQVAIGSFGYKQNLFISGYTNWLKNEGNPGFGKYLNLCVGNKTSKVLVDCIRTWLLNRNIKVIDFDKHPSLTTELIEKKNNLKKEIELLRRKNATFRSDDQCNAEAEIIILNEIDNSNFISQSIHLNKISEGKGLITWTPEATYRFLTLLSNITPSKDLLYECMTQDFFFSGFNIIDKEAISNFISPMIRQSRMELTQEMENYEDTLGKKRFKEIFEGFERQPDEMKPFYSVQTAFYLARQGIMESKVLKDRIKVIDKKVELTGKERIEYAKLKAKAAEKKRKALKARRAAQSRIGKKSKKKKRNRKSR